MVGVDGGVQQVSRPDGQLWWGGGIGSLTGWDFYEGNKSKFLRQGALPLSVSTEQNTRRASQSDVTQRRAEFPQATQRHFNLKASIKQNLYKVAELVVSISKVRIIEFFS